MTSYQVTNNASEGAIVGVQGAVVTGVTIVNGEAVEDDKK